ncbi:type I-B CRISPR-associated protein Cas5b [Thermocrinis sp.]
MSMECLKFELYTQTGTFKNPLSIKGIETYPLPPYSTVIGLLYNALGRKWEEESFQISVQGEYEAILRDYIWFKGYNVKDKELEKLPLQVPILYSLRLVIHVRAEEKLLKELEDALKKPKNLLFLSGGEYPVKVVKVKRVLVEPRRILEEEAEELKLNAYIPEELFKRLKVSTRGIAFHVPYFYKNQSKPKDYYWIDAYYLQKNTRIYGDLFLDEEGDLVFLSPNLETENEKLTSSQSEGVRFYSDNWLMAVACVGVLEVLRWSGRDIKDYAKGRILELTEDLWRELPEIYADYILRNGENTLREAYLNSKDREKFNPYNTLILGTIGDFHNNSPFTNQSLSFIKRLKGAYKEDNPKQTVQEVKKSFLEAYGHLISQQENTGKTCFFCKEREARAYANAVHFTPLFASMETRRNFFWDPIPICKECEFLLYFSSVGFYKVSGQKYLFVYVPDDLLGTYELNLALREEGELERERFGRLLSVIKHLVEREREKSLWILQNIYFVEVEKVGDATANIYSFHISPKLASAIKEHIQNYPQALKSVFSEFLFYIYTGRSLYDFLFLMLSGFVKKESFKNLKGNTLESKLVLAGKNLKTLSALKFLIKFQEVLSMGQFDKTIDWAYAEGRKLKEAYSQDQREKAEKKIATLTYRLMEAVRRRDTDQFTQNLIRAYLDVEKEIPYVFKEALKDENFNKIVYAFLLGLNAEGGRIEGNSETSE